MAWEQQWDAQSFSDDNDELIWAVLAWKKGFLRKTENIGGWVEEGGERGRVEAELEIKPDLEEEPNVLCGPGSRESLTGPANE